MEYIAHRVNELAALQALDGAYGVEIDIRDGLDGRIYMAHDPFTPGEDFETYLKAYRHGRMIVNVKSERVELQAQALLAAYGITEYFFLDSSFPMIYALSSAGEKNIAIRFSEFEGMDQLATMAGSVTWVWVDCFTRFPLTRHLWKAMQSMGYKVCLVSPELQGRPEDIEAYASILLAEGIEPDAICTKVYNIPLWQRCLSQEDAVCSK